MIMIRSYVPGISRRCTTSCCWCIRNRMTGSTRRIQWRSLMVSWRVIFTFHHISDFLRFTLFLNFRSFSNGQKVRKLWSLTFSSSTVCKSRFFSTKKKKKNWFWVLRRVSVAIVTFMNKQEAPYFLQKVLVIFVLLQ